MNHTEELDNKLFRVIEEYAKEHPEVHIVSDANFDRGIIRIKVTDKK